MAERVNPFSPGLSLIHIYAGRVLINDKPAKASSNVKEGDVITIQFGNKDVKVEVLDVQETVRTVSYTHLDVYKRQVLWCS